ncbi:MAG: hypothetical protein J5I50_00770 [Chitinophagaceae bacterium]|nr:hypothetical protein [Chitinophagaceae bacterium]
MKHYKIVAVIAAVLMVASCFMPWAYYPDRDEVFTGFYSYQNLFGKPGAVFIFFAVVYLIFVFIDRMWAKRTNIFVAAISLAYLIRTYIIYTKCYFGTCPEKRMGMYLLIAASVLLLITALLPKLDLNEGTQEGASSE